VEALLDFAAELERRDADVGRALDAAEQLEADIDEIRADAEDAFAFLAAVPGRIARLQVEERNANADREAAEAAVEAAAVELERTQGETARLEAQRKHQKAEDALADAMLEFARASVEVSRAVFEQEQRKAYAETLGVRAAQLAGRVRDVPPPVEGLEGTIEWAARARGALLLGRSSLERERDAIVRQAIELAANVAGEPATPIAGLRPRGLRRNGGCAVWPRCAAPLRRPREPR
jgi:chromosome segregation ATPase